jgi:hypothetical protein
LITCFDPDEGFIPQKLHTMDPVASSLTVINGLVKPLLLIAGKDWSSRQEFLTLRHLAHERISRELHWNLECIWKLDSDASPYASLLRTAAFDELVSSGVPLDLLFSDSIRSEWLDTSPYNNSQFQARIEHSSTVSDLLDRAYNRIWMLVHRSSHCLAMGDVVYLRTLIQFTLIHVNVVRYSLRPTQKSFGLMARSVVAGMC